MKSILFENGKLYVVELPDKAEFYETIPGTPDCLFLHDKYEEAHAAALAKPKVEVKNPEVIGIVYGKDKAWWVKVPESNERYLKEGDTFLLPDGIEVDQKWFWPEKGSPYLVAILKRIEPEKSIARRIYDETPQEVKDKVRYYGNEVVSKSVEPEKPEEDKKFEELTLMWELTIAYENFQKSGKYAIPELVKLYSIQRKKS